MKKMLFTLAIAGLMTLGTGVAIAAPPHDIGAGHNRHHNESNHRGFHNPPPRHHHHGHHMPPPVYRSYYTPMIPMNQVISVNSPNGSYYFSTPYYAYPTYSYGYYPNKTLTVRTKHVLFSI